MKVLRIEESREPCAESGWYAYDLFLSRKIEKEDILSLGSHGDLTYLAQLKTPFYKLNQPYFYIQGLEGITELRIAVFLEAEKEVMEEVTGWLGQWKE